MKTEIKTYKYSDENDFKNSFQFDININIANPSNEVKFNIGTDLISKHITTLNNLYHSYNYKENIYIVIIRNLIKKYNFLDLSYQLTNGSITEEEFEKELNENLEKYIIHVAPLYDPLIIDFLVPIIKKIGVEFNIDEVADLVGIKKEELISNFEVIHKINE